MAINGPIAGVLAVQGNFAEHAAVIRKIGMQPLYVRQLSDLLPVTHLVVPGGESTVMRKLLQSTGLDKSIIARAHAGTLALLGGCAGAILLATEVTGKNAPAPLKIIDITVDRNAYGTQVDSFDASLSVAGIGNPVSVSFIRAPVITRVGEGVVVLAEHEGKPVIVRSGPHYAVTCHPEMRGETAVHEMFLSSAH